MESKVTWQGQPLDALLEQHFSISAGFHSGQRDIIEHLIQGKRVLAIQRTGWGKSPCYQMASLFHSHLTLVFSPLKALMRQPARFPLVTLSERIPEVVTHFLEKEFLPCIEKHGTEAQKLMRAGAKVIYPFTITRTVHSDDQ